jgi:hypothetical protein
MTGGCLRQEHANGTLNAETERAEVDLERKRYSRGGDLHSALRSCDITACVHILFAAFLFVFVAT